MHALELSCFLTKILRFSTSINIKSTLQKKIIQIKKCCKAIKLFLPLEDFTPYILWSCFGCRKIYKAPVARPWTIWNQLPFDCGVSWKDGPCILQILPRTWQLWHSNQTYRRQSAFHFFYCKKNQYLSEE